MQVGFIDSICLPIYEVRGNLINLINSFKINDYFYI